MAFHVACPLTCRKICNCALGSAGPLRRAGGRDAFERNAAALQRLLGKSPLMITTGEDTVEVLVPRLSKESSKKKQKKKASPASAAAVTEAEGDAEDVEEEGDVEADVEEAEVEADAEPEPEAIEPEQQPEVIPESKPEPEVEHHVEEEPSAKVDEEPAADDEPPDDAAETSTPEEPAVPEQEAVCGLCIETEISGVKKLLSCEGCQRVFHRKCVKSFAAHRDLFNWASWRCPYCRTCEDCKATGDPSKNKLMFCKRCDEAHHNNCKQAGAKVSTIGPYVCPKHAQCHSCATRLPGGGPSSRWSHSYLFCDACGRLFSRNKYCPICLKVYRESEPTPMVECDICQHWLHCVCEGISDEKYQEFQTIADLKFTCAACRGECFKATNLDDAITELWKRKDEADREQVEKARASAGLPSESEMAELCPSSDDEQPALPAKEPSKKEGKWVIKFVKKQAPEQKSSPSTKAVKGKGGKSKGTVADGEAGSHDVDEESKSKKSSKKRKQVADDVKAKEEKQPSLRSGTKITLHVPAKRPAAKEQTTSSEDTKEDEMVEQQSDDGAPPSEVRRKRVPSSKYRDMETPATKRTRLNDDADVSKKKVKPAETTEPEAERKPIRLKFRKQEVETPAPRGQRSKRKRPSTSHEEEAAVEEHESDEDDTSILQRLGLDAVTKRVEVFRADKAWSKGTIATVNQRRSQFTVHFDNGDKKTQKYGKEKVRLLGKR